MTRVLKYLAFFSLPFTVVIFIPYLILSLSDVMLPKRKSSDNLITTRFFVGLFFIIIGLAGMALTVWMFFTLGKGTPAPWSPAKRLIISGPYAHVRNPMISSVLILLLGEALIFASWELLAWCIVFLAINHAYFILVEEPGLARRFGKEYCSYKKNVPRWIPRKKSWKPAE